MTIELNDIQLNNLYYAVNKVKLEKEQGMFTMLEMNEIDELVEILNDAMDAAYSKKLWEDVVKRHT